MTAYSTLSLSEIMMHQITRSSRDAEFELTLTEEPVELSPQNREFLTNRLIDALGGRDLPIVEDATIDSPTPARVRALWSEPAMLVAESRSMAEELKERQPRTALPGLLVVARGTLSGDDVLVVAKIEHQTAIRIRTQTNEAGHQVFLLERLRELVFGDGARVYKVAVFSRAASSTGPLGGDIADVQNRGGFAAYFLTAFLGMKLREEPAVLTSQFLERMTRAINGSSLDAESKLEVQSALITHLGSNLNRVDPRGFIRDYVPADSQAEIARLAEHERVPMSQFTKDTSQVTSKLKRLRMDYTGGIVLIAPPDQVGEGKAVTVESGANPGEDIVTIQGGQLGEIRGNGTR